jgi:WD40 repeat protein
MKRHIVHTVLWSLFILSSPILAEEPILVIDPHGHSAQISEVMFTPDGTMLISVSDDKTIRLWDVESGDLIKTIRGQIGDGHEGMLFAGALSPNGKILAVGGFLGKSGDDPELHLGQIRLFNIETGEQIGVIKGHENVVFGLDFSSDGKWLASGSGDRAAMIWDISPLLTEKGTEAKLIAILGGSPNPGPPVFDVAFSPRNKRIVVSTAFWRRLMLHEIRKNPVDVQGFGVLKSYYDMERHADQVYCVAYAPNGEYIVSGGEDGMILLWDGTGKFIKQIDQSQSSVGTVSFSADSTKIVASGFTGKETRVYSIPSGEKLTDFTEHNNTVQASAFYGNNLVATAGGDDNDIYIWDATSGTIKTHITGKGKIPLVVGFGGHLQLAFGNTDLAPSDAETEVLQHFPEYTPLEKLFDFSDMLLNRSLPADSKFKRIQTEYQGKTLERDSSYTVRITDDTNSETIENYPNFDGLIRAYTFTKDGNIVVGSSYTLKLYDDEGIQIREFVGHIGEVTAVSISEDGRILASASTDQTIKLWNLNTGECLATLFVASDHEWICWTPQGYYAASAGGEQYIGWHLNQGREKAAEYYPVSIFRKKFHHPELVKRTIVLGSFKQALEAINAESRQEIKETTVTDVLPPRVEWITPKEVTTEAAQDTINVHAKIHSDKDITDLRILVNGRTQATKRGLVIDRGKLLTEKNEIEQEITLSAGKNEIAIFAANSDAGATSEKRIVLYNIEWLKPKMYMVSIGISNYEKGELQLEYADDDAQAMSRLFQAQEGKLYKSVTIKELYNEDATRNNILDALEWLEKETTQKDVAIIFVAAHGANDDKGNYYLLPTDSDPEKLRRTGVDWGDFVDILGNLPSRVLFFLDTCHSGQLGKNLFRFRGTEVDNTEAIRELASDENGVVILAASTGKEFSMEHPDWEHGAFTRALLDGMEAGEADQTPDSVIYLRELDYYISERVKELTEGNQHPTTLKPSTISRFPIVQIQ